MGLVVGFSDPPAPPPFARTKTIRPTNCSSYGKRKVGYKLYLIDVDRWQC